MLHLLFFYRSGSIVSSSAQWRKESVTILEKAEDEEDEQQQQQQTYGSGLPDTVLLLPPQSLSSTASILPEVKTWVDESAVVEVDQVVPSGTNKQIPRRLSATTNLGKF